MLEQYLLLPMYLKDDDAIPSEYVDYTTYIKGVARLHPTAWSSTAFVDLGIRRNQACEDHDTEKDVALIMDNIIRLERYVEEHPLVI